MILMQYGRLGWFFLIVRLFYCRFADLALSSGLYWLLIIETYLCIYPFHVPLKKLSTGSIFHDIDAIWSSRLIFFWSSACFIAGSLTLHFQADFIGCSLPWVLCQRLAHYNMQWCAGSPHKDILTIVQWSSYESFWYMLITFRALDISEYVHITVYMIDQIIHVVLLIKRQNTWILLQPLPCDKNFSRRFHIELHSIFHLCTSA